MARHPTRSDRRPSGAAAVEFALTLPLLMLLLLGCVDFGRVGYQAIALANATGAGAQYGATHRVTSYSQSSWETSIFDTVAEDLEQMPGFDADQLDVSAVATHEVDGNVIITVSVQYLFTTIVDWPSLPHEVELTHTVAMRQYR